MKKKFIIEIMILIYINKKNKKYSIYKLPFMKIIYSQKTKN